jgi:hypothetical protein
MKRTPDFNCTLIPFSGKKVLRYYLYILKVVILIQFIQYAGISDSFAKTLSNTSFAFKAEVPVQWVLSKVDTNSYCISDESKQRKAKIYLQRTYIDTISILEESEYAKTYFISNLSVARSYGKVINWDTSTNLRVGQLRAYDLYAHYKPSGSSSSIWYAEYGRWCSKNHLLFQITVFSNDTNEIDTHIEEYVSLLDSIMVWDPDQQIVRSNSPAKRISPAMTFQQIKSDRFFDLCGRKMSIIQMPGVHDVSGCLITKGKVNIVFREIR